jgi:hypothetical protein
VAKRWYRWFVPSELATQSWATPALRKRAWTTEVKRTANPMFVHPVTKKRRSVPFYPEPYRDQWEGDEYQDEVKAWSERNDAARQELIRGMAQGGYCAISPSGRWEKRRSVGPARGMLPNPSGLSAAGKRNGSGSKFKVTIYGPSGSPIQSMPFGNDLAASEWGRLTTGQYGRGYTYKVTSGGRRKNRAR